MLTSFIIGAIIGYLIFHLTTHDYHPKSIKKKLPRVKYKNIELSPNIKIRLKSRELWLHHWINLAVLFVIAHVYSVDTVLAHTSFQGFIVGGVAQGLTYKDRFQIFYRISQRNNS